MADDDTSPMPPRPCLMCGVAMHATETDKRIMHQCPNCAMTITIVLPKANDEDE